VTVSESPELDGEAPREPESVESAATAEAEEGVETPPEDTSEETPAEAPEESPEETADPYAEFMTQLRRMPGEWYVVHSYAGYENRV
jgi:transcriptional antiterminator NusG